MSLGKELGRDRLHERVKGFTRCRVVVLGDLVADEFVHGDIARVSREAPVLVLDERQRVVVPGGGGNAVANLRALGADPVPVGILGKDDVGKRILERFRELGVSTRFIFVEAGYSTPTKSRILAGGVHTRRQQIVRLDRGAPHGELSPATLARLTRQVAEASRRADGLLVADYGYGSAAPSVALPPAARRRRPGIPVTVDSRSRVASFRRVLACTPNQEELERALGLSALATDRSVAEAGRTLLERTGDGAILVTRGAKGMCLVERGRSSWHLPAFGAGEVADVTGAGDTVISVFTLALLGGAAFREAAYLSNLAAGLVVMKYGTATVGRAELDSAIEDEAAS